MKITAVNIPADSAMGLEEIKMSKLGNIVLIAGKNGSGKSRLLTKIKSELYIKPSKTKLSSLSEDTRNIESNIKHSESRGIKKERILTWKWQVRNNKNLLERRTFIQTDMELEDGQYVSFDFVPKQLVLRDPYSLKKGEIKEYSENILLSSDINNIQEQTLSAIQTVQDKWFNAMHQASTIPVERKNEILDSYERLCEYIEIFLDTRLDRDENGDATLFGFRLGDSRLSDGQKILLQFCMAIYSKETKLSDLILMLDEPENHLHPEALLSLLDKLVKAVSNGQIWIATHSINLLAHFDPNSIWYVENGKVSFKGNQPKAVLNGLIGDEDEIHRLSNFLSLPAIMAANQFAFECLFEPKTVMTGNDDAQTNQIIESIDSLLQNSSSIKVLDFGAGKVRLLSTIRELNTHNNINTNTWLDYYAYDLQSDDNYICKGIIDSVYNEDKNRFYGSDKSFIEDMPEKTFDMVVMCNVFHEIEPKNWLKLFDKHSIFAHALKDDGILLIVEDQLLAAGEKAHQNGFMVLDKIQFKKLFAITDNYMAHDARGDGRLKAHFIKKEFLGNISELTRLEAIESLIDSSTKEIKQLRSEEKNYKNGKLHSFWAQQLANAKMAMDELKA